MTTTTDLNKWLNPNATKRPALRVGATVRIHQKIKEGDKERIQIFEGLIIKKTGQEPDITLTVRRVTDGIGIEKVIPVMAANVEKIDIVKEAGVRRAKLYYIRDRRGKAARLKENYLTDEQRKELMDLQDGKEDFDGKVAAAKAEEEKAAKETAAAPKEEAKTEEEAPAEQPTEAKSEDVKEETTEETKLEEAKSEEVKEEKAEAKPKEEDKKAE